MIDAGEKHEVHVHDAHGRAFIMHMKYMFTMELQPVTSESTSIGYRLHHAHGRAFKLPHGHAAGAFRLQRIGDGPACAARAEVAFREKGLGGAALAVLGRGSGFRGPVADGFG